MKKMLLMLAMLTFSANLLCMKQGEALAKQALDALKKDPKITIMKFGDEIILSTDDLKETSYIYNISLILDAKTKKIKQIRISRGQKKKKKHDPIYGKTFPSGIVKDGLTKTNAKELIKRLNWFN